MMQSREGGKLANRTKLEFLEITHNKFVSYFETYMLNEDNYEEFFTIFREFLLY